MEEGLVNKVAVVERQKAGEVGCTDVGQDPERQSYSTGSAFQTLCQSI